MFKVKWACKVLLSVYSGTRLPSFIEAGSYLTDTEQNISWHVKFWDAVYMCFF